MGKNVTIPIHMNIFKKVSGQGNDVVLMHGWGTNHTFLTPIADYLSRCHRVTNIDLPGAGQSDWSRATETIHDLADQVLPALPEHACFIAHSMAMPIAVSIAARYPHRVTKLIGLGGIPKFLADGDWRGFAKPGFVGAFVPLAKEKGLKSTLEEFFSDNEFADFDPKPEQYHRMVALLNESRLPNIDVLAKGLEICDTVDVREEFSSLSCPIDLIFGSREHIFGDGGEAAIIAGCEQLKALAKQTHTHIISGGHHYTFWTHTQEVNKLLDQLV